MHLCVSEGAGSQFQLPYFSDYFRPSFIVPAKAITLKIGQEVGVEHRFPTGILPINTFDYDAQSIECNAHSRWPVMSKGRVERKSCVIYYLVIKVAIEIKWYIISSQPLTGHVFNISVPHPGHVLAAL